MLACLSFPSQRLYGSAEGLLAAQRNPTTPLDRVLHHGKEAAARVAYLNSLKEEHKGNPYMDYALTREGEFYADPANIAHEELLLPKVGWAGVRGRGVGVAGWVAAGKRLVLRKSAVQGRVMGLWRDVFSAGPHMQWLGHMIRPGRGMLAWCTTCSRQVIHLVRRLPESCCCASACAGHYGALQH